MDLDYSTPGELKIGMIQYLEGILEGFSEEIVKTSSTPAADHLFHIRDEDDPKKQYLTEECAR